MILDTTITVQQKSASRTAEGLLTIVWTASNTTELAGQQPLSGKIAYEEYGISDGAVSDLFFVQTSSAAVEGGRILDASGRSHDIYKIEKFPNHYEVICRKVVE